MAALAAILQRGLSAAPIHSSLRRFKTTSAQHVAARPTDPTFEKLMDNYKHLLKVIAVQDLILASPSLTLPLPLLSAAAQRLRLTRGAPHFVRTYPHIFSLLYDPSTSLPILRLTPAAATISRQESAAAAAASDSLARLERLLSLSPSGSVPLRAVFKVWRELGLPDDFEDSVLRKNPCIFSLRDNPRERNTHLLELTGGRKPNRNPNFKPAVEEWRNQEGQEMRYAFKQGFPPGMRLSKNFRTRLKEWQRLPYAGPYEVMCGGGKKSKAGMRAAEKQAVGIAHEFLSLTVEKMVEVEKISQFRKWFGIELNIRDMFVDHPGIFYLSTKGKRHTVFLREAYDRGRLIESNPIYEARRQLLDLVMLRRRGVVQAERTVAAVAEEEE